ncbi:MAG: glycosyltransferase family 87 protein [Candidatus Kapaibacterium sp.]
MVLLTCHGFGLASWAEPIPIWYGMSVAWLALVTSFLQSTPQHRSIITRRALLALLVCLASTALPYGLFTDDILRYQWDGWLTIHQVSPFSSPPIAHDVQDLRYDNGTHILPDSLPYSSLLTIYPPGAQLLFAFASLFSGGDTIAWKLVLWMTFIALGVTAWRMSEPQHRKWMLLCALSPVVLLHGFIDGHIDLAMALVMIMSISARDSRRIILSGVLLGAAVSIKYLPIVALPVLLIGLDRRDQARLFASMLGALIVIYLPFVGPNLLGSLGTFTTSWQTNSAAYTLLTSLVSDALTRPLLVILGLVCSGVIINRWRSQPVVALALTLVTLAVLSPVVHPWYLIAPLALMPLAPLRSVITWTCTVCLYAVGYSNYKGSAVWLEHPAALAFEFVPVVVALIVDVQRGPLALLQDDRS